MSDAFEVSAAYLGSIVEGARANGALEAALPLLDEQARRAVEAPHSNRWWPGSVSNGLSDALYQACGEQVLARVTQAALKKRLGGFVMPLIGVALAVSGNSPSAIFSRFGTLTSIAVRGLQIDWEERSPTSGRLRVAFPHALTPSLLPVWTTTLRYAYELCRRTGRVSAQKAADGSPVIDFELDWDPAP